MKSYAWALCISAIVLGNFTAALAVELTAPRMAYGGLERQAEEPSSDPKVVWLKEAGEGEARKLWTGKGNIDEIVLSPSSELVAFRERVQDGDDGSWQLVVLDLAGKRVAQLPSVYRYCWSPDAASIAYILGTDIEGGMGFRSSGSGIYTVSDRKRNDLPVAEVVDLNWAAFDATLYLLAMDDGKEVVWSYRSGAKNPQRTKHRGIYFSPQGGHYYRPGYDGTRFGVYETASGEAVQGASGTRGIDPEMEFAQPRGWVDEEQLVLPGTGGTRGGGATLFNIKTGKVSSAGGLVVQSGDASRGLVIVPPAKVK